MDFPRRRPCVGAPHPHPSRGRQRHRQVHAAPSPRRDGLSRAAAPRAASEWLDRFGAAAYARTPMTRLSKGSSQKVAVAQALLAEPELPVLDEARTGLDEDARAALVTAAATAVTCVLTSRRSP